MPSYTVKAGDTLGDIAYKNGTDATSLAKINGISNPNLIQPGQVINFAPTTPPVNSIPATSLGNNSTTYQTAPTLPPTGSTGLAETATASKDAYIATAAKEAADLKAKQDAQLTQAKSLFDRLGMTATSKANAYETSGLNTDKKAIDELTNQMEATGRSYDKQIETLTTTNPEGMLASGVQASVNKLTREKASTMADLAIVLNAKTRNYDTAKAIVDQKADAETEDLKTQLSSLQFFFDQNSSTLSKDQQMVLTDKIDAANKEYQDAKAMRTQIGDLQLAAAKNGAPISVVKAIGKTSTIEDATKAAGSYVSSSSGFDLFTPEDKRRIVQSGLDGATTRVQEVFLNTPAEFQQTYIRNGFGNKEVTPEILLKNLSDWEAAKAAAGNGDASVNALITALQSGG